MVKSKRKIFYALLAALALLLGLGFQIALGVSNYRNSTARALELLSNLGESAQAEAETLLTQRRTEAQKAAARLSPLPEDKRNAHDARSDELLIIVNPWNPLPEDYECELEDMGRKNMIDARCADALRQMLADCEEAGYEPYICSAWRSHAHQQKLFYDKVKRLWDSGVPRSQAEIVAATEVAVPGTSEHELGLAVDLIDSTYTRLDKKQETTGTQIWLMENCWRYGFILRYPNGTTEVTGIIYEPWHYRYVGKEDAELITRMGLTLEEYCKLREGR